MPSKKTPVKLKQKSKQEMKLRKNNQQTSKLACLSSYEQICLMWLRCLMWLLPSSGKV